MLSRGIEDVYVVAAEDMLLMSWMFGDVGRDVLPDIGARPTGLARPVDTVGERGGMSRGQ